MKRSRDSGFTLIEVLVVLTILGILLGVVGLTSLRSVRLTQLREGAVQLANDLERARVAAQRDSQDATVTLTSTSPTAPNAGYSVTTSGGSARTLTLPGGTRVAPYNATTPGTVTFGAPHGEVDPGGGVVWVVSSPVIGDLLYVKTVGVTGKVVLSATY